MLLVTLVVMTSVTRLIDCDDRVVPPLLSPSAIPYLEPPEIDNKTHDASTSLNIGRVPVVKFVNVKQLATDLPFSNTLSHTAKFLKQ